jgi:hypothetical protein
MSVWGVGGAKADITTEYREMAKAACSMGDFEGLEEAVAEVEEQGALGKRDVEKPHVAGKANSTLEV